MDRRTLCLNMEILPDKAHHIRPLNICIYQCHTFSDGFRIPLRECVDGANRACGDVHDPLRHADERVSASRCMHFHGCGYDVHHHECGNDREQPFHGYDDAHGCRLSKTLLR